MASSLYLHVRNFMDLSLYKRPVEASMGKDGEHCWLVIDTNNNTTDKGGGAGSNPVVLSPIGRMCGYLPFRGSACVSLGSTIYLLGGVDYRTLNASLFNDLSSEMWHVDTQDDNATWTQGPSVIGKRCKSCAVSVHHQQKIYLFGGIRHEAATPFALVFDIKSNSWSEYTTVPEFIAKSVEIACVLLNDNTILLNLFFPPQIEEEEEEEHKFHHRFLLEPQEEEEEQKQEEEEGGGGRGESCLYSCDLATHEWKLLDGAFGVIDFNTRLVLSGRTLFGFKNNNLCGYDLETGSWFRGPVLFWEGNGLLPSSDKFKLTDDVHLVSAGTEMLLYLLWEIRQIYPGPLLVHSVKFRVNEVAGFGLLADIVEPTKVFEIPNAANMFHCLTLLPPQEKAKGLEEEDTEK